jgi:hypothetical protein
MIYLQQKPNGPPPPGTWVINKDSPQAQGLIGWWVAAGTRVVAPDFSGRKLHGAGGSACTAVSNDLGPAIQTNDNDVTNGYINCGGFRLPVGTTEYSAMLDAVPTFISSTHRYFGIGQVNSGVRLDWGGAFVYNPGGTTPGGCQFNPVPSSAVASGAGAVAVGRRLVWMGAYKSGVACNQYIDGNLNGSSTSISGALTSTQDLVIGRQWDIAPWAMQFREARIYDRFVTEAEAADWYGEHRWDLYYELGRRTFFTVPAAGGPAEVATSDTVLVTLSEATALLPLLTATDSLATLLNEATPILLSDLQRTDTLLPVLTESQTSDLTTTASDSLAVLLSEVAAVFIPANVTDTLSPLIAEQATITVSLSRTDSLSVLLSELATSLITSQTSDTLAVQLSEVASIIGTMTLSDSLTLTLAEAATLLVALNGTDTLSVLTTDAVNNLTSFLQRADSINVLLTESPTLFSRSDVTDTVSVTLSDLVSLLAVQSALDTLSVTVSDVGTLDISGVFNVSTSDSLLVLLSEAITQGIQLDRTDTLSVKTDQSASIFGTAQVADTLGVTLTELAGILVRLTRTDTVSPQLLESATLSVMLHVVDQLQLTLTEQVALLVYLNRTDSLDVNLQELIQLQGLLQRSDTASVLLDEVAARLPTINVNDLLAVLLQDDGTVDQTNIVHTYLKAELVVREALAASLVQVSTGLVASKIDIH